MELDRPVWAPVGKGPLCLVSCNGPYADFKHLNHTDSMDESYQLKIILEQYYSLKEQVAKNIYFDLSSETLSKNPVSHILN